MASGIGKSREEARQNADILTKALIYRVSGLEIDPSRVLVRRGEHAIPLRPKTFQFLLFLLERSDRVVSKDELIAGLWPDTAVTDDVLVRSMGELRKALEDDPKNPQIFKTYPKLGYGVEAPVEKSSRLPIPAPAPVAVTTPSTPFPWGMVLVIAAALAVVIGSWFAWRAWTRPPVPVGVDDLAEVGWWRLDEAQGLKAKDSSGNGLTGALRWEAHWVPGGGLLLDGTEARIEGAAGKRFPLGDEPRSVTAWIKTTSPPLEDTSILEYGIENRSPGMKRFALSMHPDGRIALWGARAYGPVLGSTRVDDSAWHLVGATYEAGNPNRVRVYVDGRVDAREESSDGTGTMGPSAWSIGHFFYTGSAFRGTLRDVRVFNQVVSEARMLALYRCSAGVKDTGNFYFFPIHEDRVTIADHTIVHDGKAFGGIQLGKSDGVCSIDSQRGADAGQDVRMSLDLLVPATEEGKSTQAGPYFRSRRAAPGDGLIGGTSAGYWIQLWSTGEVRVRRLNPQAVVAFSSIPNFDSTVFHHMEVEARGNAMKASIDGRPIVFTQEGKSVESVAIPPAWEGVGYNRGTAGIFFSSMDARGEAGGQQARNFVIERL